MKKFIFIAPVALFAAVIMAFVFGLQHDPSKLTSVLIDKPLPQFVLPAVGVHDAGLKSANFRGQPMLLNVFASWCVSCRMEHALLLRLKSEGVPIQGLDWKDDAADAAKYLTDNGTGKVRYKFIGPMAVEDWDKTIKPLLDRLRTQS